MSAPIFETFGCRLNAYETEAMRHLAGARDGPPDIVVNTCAVTTEAVRQARQKIRRLRRDHPDSRLIVTGCAAQIDPGQFAAMPEVDLVVGNAEKLKPEIWQRLARDHTEFDGESVLVDDIMSVRECAPQLIDGFGTRTRAYVQIQNGCDHRCTFCIIPYGRGNSRSVPAGVVVDQIRRLVQGGYREVVLTGVDLTSWGADLPGTPRLGFLVSQILKLVPELPRLRLSSIDGIEADPRLLDVITSEPRLMPHLHLSLQSGDDMILKRMKRRHSRQDAITLCRKIRKSRPDVVFGADIIAGFPTETDEMFENSMRILDECGLTWLHVFPFSPRHGTPAARMPQLPRKVITERAQRLRSRAAERVQGYLASRLGRTERVLMETPRMGRTEQFAEVSFASDREIGAIVETVITGRTVNRLTSG
ncbi:MAG: tRNA (N(6)-L-threonylcarbamoyladenosine(37)-C(2))-methylthiotransferase MtaB [Alphaproteobacteria bacterium]|nr:MAG: tRNA (N(6)-L-threonylcarbamoyladenosine(37)-C(2))-methylthiotransferase MtaB [Alphaproteobacteria bacterium]